MNKLNHLLSVRRLWQALGFSLSGLKTAVSHETAFQQELICCLVLIPLACYLSQSTVETVLLVGSLLLVLIVELVNSAVEAIVDRISLEQHHLSGRAKDLGSAAVFIAILNAIFVWIVLLL